jgi:hypothetical protein
VVSNPPWDLRLSEGAAESWEALGRFLKREAGGSEAFLLSGNPDVTRGLRMKVERKRPIEQSGLSLRLLKYNVLPPKPKPVSALDADAAAAVVPGDEPNAAAAAPAASAAPAPAPAAPTAAEAATKPKRGRPRKAPLPQSTSPQAPPTPPTPPQASAAPSPSMLSRSSLLSSTAATLLGALVGLGGLSGLGPAAQDLRASAASGDRSTTTMTTTTTTTEKLRREYDGYARGYDALDGGPVAGWLGLDGARAEVVGGARGRVLECGVGTGLNLPFYRRDRVARLDAVDLSPGMLREARARAEGLGLGLGLGLAAGGREEGAGGRGVGGEGAFPVQFHERDVTRLEGFADGGWDTVVDTFSLWCVVVVGRIWTGLLWVCGGGDVANTSIHVSMRACPSDQTRHNAATHSLQCTQTNQQRLPGPRGGTAGDAPRRQAWHPRRARAAAGEQPEQAAAAGRVPGPDGADAGA